MFLRGTNRELTAIAEGGSQRTVWPANDAVMRLTGPAEIVCRGEAFLGNAAVADLSAARARVKPAALRAGATLAVVSPASATKPELVQAGMEALRRAWV